MQRRMIADRASTSHRWFVQHSNKIMLVRERHGAVLQVEMGTSGPTRNHHSCKRQFGLHQALSTPLAINNSLESNVVRDSIYLAVATHPRVVACDLWLG